MSAFWRELSRAWTGSLFGEPSPSVSAEIDALDEPVTCATCEAELSQERIDDGADECPTCELATWRERLADERDDR